MSSRRRVAEKGLQIANPDKVLYPAGKFTKADVLSYYERVARFLLPHFRSRPVTLKRYPNGVFGEAFYEKDAPGFTPRWVKRFPVPRREGGPDINYILINDVRTLTWAANMAALELHPFSASRAAHRASDAYRIRSRSGGRNKHPPMCRSRVFGARYPYETAFEIVP